jgi:hypothetical protein
VPGTKLLRVLPGRTTQQAPHILPTIARPEAEQVRNPRILGDVPGAPAPEEILTLLDSTQRLARVRSDLVFAWRALLSSQEYTNLTVRYFVIGNRQDIVLLRRDDVPVPVSVRQQRARFF